MMVGRVMLKLKEECQSVWAGEQLRSTVSKKSFGEAEALNQTSSGRQESVF